MKIKPITSKIIEVKMTAKEIEGHSKESIKEFLRTLLMGAIFDGEKVNEDQINKASFVPMEWNKNKQPIRFIILI